MTAKRPQWQPELDPLPAPDIAITPEITESECRICEATIAGLDGRYSCGVCGWSNHWSEGHRPLPGADADPDAPHDNLLEGMEAQA
ncbi:hypothetical protein [Streptomyces sp. A 4/2]|uniref:hypothetical protein n=1 Tax=Streptomyces sp. A 4/2 TaxID=2934314 RepID=UPI002024D842|nr:hypothetical protein [Streptomyces sp. A 4/2]